MKYLPKTFAAVVLAAALTLGGSVPVYGASRQYDDFDSITSHVTLSVPQTLGIGSPAESLTTSADAYYISGTSNPKESLYLNGDLVEGRGIYGSFGVYVGLSDGKNVFTFTQGESASGNAGTSVAITKGTPPIYPVTGVSGMYPAVPVGHQAGQPALLKCTAPAGGTVTAVCAGRQYELTQQTVTAAEGSPVVFQVEALLPDIDSVKDVGPVKYVLNYDGKEKAFYSPASVLLSPKDQKPVIQVLDTAATVFATSNTNGDIKTVVKTGAMDYVANQTETCYQLGMGGWIPKESVRPIIGSVDNTLTAVAFSKTAYGERYKFTGAANAISTSWQTGDKLYLELHHTTGSVELPTADSELFSGARVTPGDDSVILEFDMAPGKELWGHTVEYLYDETTFYCKYPPVSAGDTSKPLTGIIVALDAGHGGTDPGAFGTARALGPTEKDITYATALAVKKRLESLGATVLLPAPKEQKSSFSDRMQEATDQRADFFLSLHCNSVEGSGVKPNGVETYYYYSRSKALADSLQRSIVAATGRTDRGVKNNAFRVTLNSLTPAVLIEMGFASNPAEYDRLCSREGIFQMANAIGNGLTALV